jgi:NhaC family Na+:H+ antiporter
MISITIGTSWGSAATVGVALMGIAQGLGVSLPITAAAIVGGAYFGDKLSPLSDTTNLASAISGVGLYEHIRHMLYTTVPSTLVALVIYLFLGFGNQSASVVSQEVSQMLEQLGSMYNFNIIVLLPIVLVLLGAFIKMPTLPTMLGSGFVAIIIGVLVQGHAFIDGLNAVMSGFTVKMTGFEGEVLPKISMLLNRGGLKTQGSFLTFIFSAMVFAGIVSGTGMLDKALSSLASKIKGAPGAVFGVIVSCFATACMTGSGGLTIVLPGEIFRNVFIKLKIHPRVLSRTLEDSGTLLMPIIPWTAAGVYMVSVLDVPTLEYLPYSFFNYLGMVFAMIFAFTGFGIPRLTDKEAQDLSETEISAKILG